MAQSPLTELMYGGRWRMLSTDWSKMETFAEDPHFRHGLVSACEVLGESLAAVLRRHAFLLIQPDCLARRMARRCLTFVEQHSFRPVHTMQVRLDPAVVDGLWYYQSGNSTPDSKAVGDLVCGRTDSLLVLLRDEAPAPDLPASMRLTLLKGPARSERRSAWHLRTLIGAQGPLVVLIHTSDEPLDMIREAALICGPSVRELYTAMTGPVQDAARTRLISQIAALYRETEAHDLDTAAAMARLCDTLVAIDRDAQGSQAARRLLSTLAAVRAGDDVLDWQRFATDLHGVGIDPSGWDPVLLGSRYIQLEVADVPRRFAVVHREAAEPVCDTQPARREGMV
jgi:hypothetical protein